MDGSDGSSMRCAGCGYDLAGLLGCVCPECSRAFDPDDPRTFVERWSPWWVRSLKLRSRWLGYVAVSGVVFGAMWTTVAPRPFISWDGTVDPMLWEWFDRPFGVERRAVGLDRLDLHWWNGRLDRVHSLESMPGKSGGTVLATSWDLRRQGDEFRLDVPRAGVGSNSLLRAFNSMRDDDELFGVTLAPPESASGSGAITNDAAFSAEGPQEVILAAILTAYGFTCESYLITEDDEDLWVYDESLAALVRLSVEEADARGVEYGVLPGISVSRFRHGRHH